MADPPRSDILPTFNPGNGSGIASHNGKAQIWPERFGR
jgi:hypothetical protein